MRHEYIASLNSAVFSDGSFCYIPQHVVCPLDVYMYVFMHAYIYTLEQCKRLFEKNKLNDHSRTHTYIHI